MKRLLVIGGAESGVGAAILGYKQSWDVFVTDNARIAAKYKNELLTNNIPFEEEGHKLERLRQVDLLIRSPGVPNNAEIIERGRKMGIGVVSELEFGYRYTNSKIIAVTGSNGKTTTVGLIDHLLRTAGISVELGGNIGRSFARLVAEGSHPDWFVLEVSSFQLEDIEEFRPDIGIILNITPDHLDRYNGQLSLYAKTKLKLVENQFMDNVIIYNAGDENIRKYLKINDLRQKVISLDSADYGEVKLKTTKGYSFGLSNDSLLGQHNFFNAKCAVEVALCLGIDSTIIQKGLDSFNNKPHRMERVAVINGVEFINDSKATNVDSVKYAIIALTRPVIWIAGGIDKGNDYEELKSVVKGKVKVLICLGTDNTKLVSSFKDDIPVIKESSDMNEAVKISMDHAEKGDVILLSPACASFDLFDNYEDRGNQFKKATFNTIRRIRTKS